MKNEKISIRFAAAKVFSFLLKNANKKKKNVNFTIVNAKCLV